MSPFSLHYFPVALPFLLLLAGLFLLIAGGVAIRILNFASASMGIGPGPFLVLMLMSLLGS